MRITGQRKEGSGHDEEGTTRKYNVHWIRDITLTYRNYYMTKISSWDEVKYLSRVFECESMIPMG